jgi:pimeloyl-ACP methyl ester carboxylesterase
MLPAAVVCLLSRRLFGWALPTLMPELPREVAEDLTQMTWRSSTSTLWQAIYEYDLSADLARVAGRIPMLCLHGDRDRQAPLDHVLALARTHAGCEVRVRAGAEHMLPLTDAAWLRAQIASVLPPAPPGAADRAPHADEESADAGR